MTDFLIVGGGVAGLSLGAALAELGNVTLLEAEAQTGYHASGRSAAMFEESYGAPPVRALNGASRAGLEALGVLSPRGLMLIGKHGETAAFEHDLNAMQMTHMPLDEAMAMVPILNPDTVPHVAYHAEAWDIDTHALLQAYERALRKNGTVVTKARVTALRQDGPRWIAKTSAGDFEGRLLINAAGAWADDIAGLAGAKPMRLQPYRRSMARIAAPGGRDVSAWPMIFGAGEAWYAKPDAGALIVSPADEEPLPPQDAWADDMVLAEGIAAYEHHVTEPVTRLLSNWAGLRTFAPDRALIIGHAPDRPGFFWQAGQGGYGFQSSIGAARLGADLIAGRPPQIPPEMVTALSPDRFA